MKDNLFVETLMRSQGIRFFVYLIILLVSTLAGIVLSFVFHGFGYESIKIGQGIVSTMMFVVPPTVYYWLTRNKSRMTSLGFRSFRPLWMLLIGIILMLVSIPFTNQLAAWNESIHLGGILSKLEEWMKDMEGNAKAATDKMLNVSSIGGLFSNLFIMALIPALGEEMTFRGVLQQSLTRSIRNPHIAIVISAALFSFVHFQFYGFMPRMFLGILMGYMFYSTGSLWTSILMHFLNNGIIVVLYFLKAKNVIDVDLEHVGDVKNVWLAMGSFMLTVFLIAYSWRNKRNHESVAKM